MTAQKPLLTAALAYAARGRSATSSGQDGAGVHVDHAIPPGWQHVPARLVALFSADARLHHPVRSIGMNTPFDLLCGATS